MRANSTARRLTASQHGFWYDSAEAQLLSSEGNRLIAREIAEGVRGLWRRAMHRLDVGQSR
ncbi:MAG TPA: hypothetical protein VK822_31755 [Acetobacteraceae bacterium]|jgi:hypothetical protein|nr:hypothetical protein [Acetobacteraceae bacterium]